MNSRIQRNRLWTLAAVSRVTISTIKTRLVLRAWFTGVRRVLSGTRYRPKGTQGIHCGGMPPLVVFSWPYGIFFLAVMFWAFGPEFRIIARQTEPATSSQDAGSK